MRPLFPYYGSKWTLAPRYPEPSDYVVEPFAGAACYAQRLEPRKVLLIDLDPVVCGVWNYLIGASQRDILGLPDLTAGQMIAALPVCQEAQWLIGFWANRGSAAPAKVASPWQVKYAAGTSGSHLVWSVRARERIAPNIHRVRDWRVLNASYADVPVQPGATYFVDPPYAVKGSRYVHSAVDFPALAAWCRGLDDAIVCEQAGADWLPFRPLATVKATRGSSAEVVWTSR